MSATATVVYAPGADDASGGSSARGVESISKKENLQKIASSAGVEASDVSNLPACGSCSAIIFFYFSYYMSPDVYMPHAYYL